VCAHLDEVAECESAAVNKFIWLMTAGSVQNAVVLQMKTRIPVIQELHCSNAYVQVYVSMLRSSPVNEWCVRNSR
jgi:hypothetical protein